MTLKNVYLGAAVGAILALAGCDDSGGTVPTPPPTSTTTRFSFFTEQILGDSANSTPVPVNGVVFDFDVNDDPNAFNYAFM
jgi:ABC-type Zn uptake system ZnuABC Zn-binding protein ZnuA